MVHQHDVDSPTIFACAQAGCEACLGRLLRHHEGLVHRIIRRSWVGSTAYEDLLQEGRVGLWRAVCGFEPARGYAFSTYAYRIIQRAVWRGVAREERQSQAPVLPPSPSPDPQATAMAAWQAEAIAVEVEKALAHLTPRARHVIRACYGIGGEPARSLAELGRHYGVSGEAVRIWRNDALVVLRLPTVCGRLSELTDQHERSAYRRRHRLSRDWQRKRRGRQP